MAVARPAVAEEGRTQRLPLAHWGFRDSADGLQLGTHSIAALSERYGTPFYLFDEERLRANARRAAADARQHLARVALCYSIKTNAHPRVLEVVNEEELGAEAISGRELRAALSAGFTPSRMIVNGPGKTDAEIRLAIEIGVRVNVESVEEARALARLAADSGRVTPAGIRINPHVHEERSLPSTRTASPVTVFGLDPAGVGFAEVVQTLRGAPGLVLDGLSAHIGTGIISAEPYRRVCRALLETRRRLAGAGVNIESLDLGGGFAVPSEVRYEEGAFDSLGVAETTHVPPPESIVSFAGVCGAIAGELANDPPATIVMEPGRLLVSDAFHLVTRVTRIKEEQGVHFAILDASRAQNALFVGRGFHEIVCARQPAEPGAVTYTLVGPLCAAFDVFATGRQLPALTAGDLVVVCDVGAYNLSAQSQWSFDPAAVVSVRADGISRDA